MNLGLDEKVVLLTGASAGIGLAAAEIFAREGAHVAIAARDRERLQEAGRHLSSLGTGKVLALAAEMSDPDAPARLVAQVEQTVGPVDVLVNNVGLAYQATFHELEDSDWDELWQLNVMSYVRSIQAVLPQMRRGGGVIVNVSSSAGKRPSVGMPHYSVTKAAVLSLSRLVADTYAKEGVRSVAICPGPTETPAWLAEGGLAEQVAERSGSSRGDALKATGKGRPIGRMASPDEVASLIAFVASDRGSYITGAALSVDGGSVPSIV